MKYAVLQRSYSAPVRVSDITDDALVAAAARAVTPGCRPAAAAVGVRAGDEAAARDTLAVSRVVVPAVAARVVAARAAVVFLSDVPRDDCAPGVSIVPRAAVDRSFLTVVEMRCCVGADRSVALRDIVLPSRTAALVAPMHNIKYDAKIRTFFISDKILANLDFLGQVKYARWDYILYYFLYLKAIYDIINHNSFTGHNNADDTIVNKS